MTGDAPLLPLALNTAVFGKLGSGDPARIRKLAQAFLSALEAYRVDLGTAVAARQADEARRVAHKIKSSARWVGAELLGTRAEVMERVPAGAGELDDLEAQLREILQAIDEVRPLIEAALAVLPAGASPA